MIRIEQMKLPLTYQEADIKKAVCRHLKLSADELVDFLGRSYDILGKL